MSEEGRKGVFRCDANHLIVHGNDITALSMRTNLLAEMKAHADRTAEEEIARLTEGEND